MRVYNKGGPKTLRKEILQTLEIIRARRGFKALDYIKAKSSLLIEYLTNNNLKACVIGISGGIDSALALGIIVHAYRQKDSPLKKVLPICLPIYTKGATNQSQALSQGIELAKYLDIDLSLLDLTKATELIKSSFHDEPSIDNHDAWAEGQLASYIRTPALYYISSLLSQKNLPSIVIGTTNRDEGAYLGFFGKASDAMVDIQIISDIHKSEVIRAAQFLKIPENIIKAIPSGDTYDGRCDEEIFGTSYDFVELYLSMRCVEEEEKKCLTQEWNEVDFQQYNELGCRLEKLHQYNAHKYKVGSPAIHLDILESAVPGGWKSRSDLKINETKPVYKNFVAPFNISNSVIKFLKNNQQKTQISTNEISSSPSIHIIENLFSENDTSILLEEITKKSWLPVSINGNRRDYKKNHSVGSLRTTTYNLDFAEIVWNKLKGNIPMILNTSKGTSIDTEEAYVWKAVGINSLFRFIQYQPGCFLIPHYDTPYNFEDGRKTLKSLIIYLTESQIPTRFIKDEQENISFSKRNYQDWKRMANDQEVMFRIFPKIGRALIFDHRTLHDCPIASNTQENNPRIIMRTDIIYQKVQYT